MRQDVSPSLSLRICRLPRSGEYQLVHSHLVHADWHSALASALVPGVPLVSTKHNDNPFRRTYPFRIAERSAANRCAATITISAVHASLHPASYRGDNRAVRVEGSGRGAEAQL
jgi:hypothetical protein